MPEWKEEIRERLASLKLAPNREAEIVEELAQHLEDRYEELLLAGATEGEAHLATLVELSESELLAHELRRVERPVKPEMVVAGGGLRVNMIADLWQDIRYCVRMMRRNSGVTLIAVVTLALGIGATTAIFSVVNAVLLRPLPYQNADRLMLVWENNPRREVKRAGPSGPTFLDWQEQNQSFADMALFEPGSGTFTGGGLEPLQLPGMRVTTNFLSLLGAKIELGRSFADEEGQGGRQNVVVITHGLWARRYGSDPSVVGRKIELDGQPYSVIGVLQPTFWFPLPADVFVPWARDELRRRDRRSRDFGVLGHLNSGVTLEQANSDLNAICQRLAQTHPELKHWGATVVPMQWALVESVRPALLILFATVGFVLLIACTNIATLMLARGTAREKEIAVRYAMGASRWRLGRQFVTESLLLGAAGGGLGLLIAIWATGLFKAFAPATIPIPHASAEALLPAIGVDVSVLCFSLLISLLTSLGFGLAPALAASRVSPNEMLKEGGRGNSGGLRHQRLRGSLVISEVALAFVLLVGAGLMIRTFWELQRVDLGFKAGNVLTAEIELPTDTKYKTGPDQAMVFKRFLDQVKTVPGVSAAALTNIVPLTQREDDTEFLIVGRASLATDEHQPAELRAVSAGYFHTLSVPVLKGREFTDRDQADAPAVVLIDQNLAQLYWPYKDPIGEQIKFSSQGAPREIVGVVAAVKQRGLNMQPKPTIYAPYLQTPQHRMSLVIRAAVAPASLTNEVKAAVWTVDKDQPIYQIKTMDEILVETKTTPTLTLILMGMFATLALVLAAVGLYGVMAYAVTQRTHEIGVRMALGAQMSDILKLILKSGMKLTSIGVLIGMAGAVALTRLMTKLLFGVTPIDTATFITVSLTLLGVALLACYIPARRATKVDPLVALRCE